MQLDAFQTLADPTRRRIVEALLGGERQVNDIVEGAGIPDGQRRLYSLKPEPFRELDQWLAQYRSLWEARLDRFGAALEARQSAARKEPET